jgi:hypothetical protein
VLRQDLEERRIVPGSPFQHLGHLAMQLAALPKEQRLVRDLLDQGVLERPASGALPHQELGPGQLLQRGSEVALTHHRLEELRGEGPSDHRGVMEQAALAGGEPVDPGQDGPLDGVGDLHLQLGQHRDAVHDGQRPELQ